MIKSDYYQLNYNPVNGEDPGIIHFIEFCARKRPKNSKNSEEMNKYAKDVENMKNKKINWSDILSIWRYKNGITKVYRPEDGKLMKIIKE
ncbi:hypothetical protein PIROE2DRAFT_12244 [Piromyces sp. E2]|nr:hypothetical protein PIROE2DRAFT_12244 [Piromyces sp. E2]|eukprot:OUM61699.1 hypothetical protein PIROE2DRAFT_12244 [Piromyces sp. E2]